MTWLKDSHGNWYHKGDDDMPFYPDINNAEDGLKEMLSILRTVQMFDHKAPKAILRDMARWLEFCIRCEQGEFDGIQR